AARRGQVTASGAAAEPPKVGSLPDEVRAAAIVLPNGEVMWARGDAPAALRAIAATGERILGLDLRSDGPGSSPRPGLATEIPSCPAPSGSPSPRPRFPWSRPKTWILR